MKTVVGILTISMLLAGRAHAEETVTYKLSSSNEAIQLVMREGREFTLKSSCRTMSGQIGANDKVIILGLKDRCRGTRADLQNLKLFQKVRDAKSAIEHGNEIRFVGDTGTSISSFTRLEELAQLK